MNNKQPLQPSLGALIKKRDFFKGVSIAAAILWLFLLGILLYFYTHNKNTVTLIIPVIAMPVAFLPVLLQIKSLTAAIKSRES